MESTVDSYEKIKHYYNVDEKVYMKKRRQRNEFEI